MLVRISVIQPPDRRPEAKEAGARGTRRGAIGRAAGARQAADES